MGPSAARHLYFCCFLAMAEHCLNMDDRGDTLWIWGVALVVVMLSLSALPTGTAQDGAGVAGVTAPNVTVANGDSNYRPAKRHNYNTSDDDLITHPDAFLAYAAGPLPLAALAAGKPKPGAHARPAAIYMNEFAVYIPGGSAVADTVAHKYGFSNLGQVSKQSKRTGSGGIGGSPRWGTLHNFNFQFPPHHISNPCFRGKDYAEVIMQK
uniref:Peptidase S8 pro-domain domain-containing protein n=1 Tax=Anopheles albimanus TaxID=7167 RepID=A0A182F7C4_ANOAL